MKIFGNRAACNERDYATSAIKDDFNLDYVSKLSPISSCTRVVLNGGMRSGGKATGRGTTRRTLEKKEERKAAPLQSHSALFTGTFGNTITLDYIARAIAFAPSNKRAARGRADRRGVRGQRGSAIHVRRLSEKCMMSENMTRRRCICT